MSRWSERIERIDGFLGRLAYRTMGAICLIVAAAAGYAAWSHLAEGRPNGWAPVIMFGVGTILALSAVPYCFSRKRTFGEALDDGEIQHRVGARCDFAMEGGTGDQQRRR